MWDAQLTKSFPTYVLETSTTGEGESTYTFSLVPKGTTNLANFLERANLSDPEHKIFEGRMGSLDTLDKLVFVPAFLAYEITRLDERGEMAILKIEGVSYKSHMLSPLTWRTSELCEPIVIISYK